MDSLYPGHPDPDLDTHFYEGVAMKRAVAWLADTVLIGLIVLFILPFTLFLGLFILPLLWLGVGLAYRTVTLAAGSATLGMRLVAIEFRNRHGGPFTPAEAATHTLIYTVGIAFFLIHLLSMALMVMGAKGQGVADHALGSVAINRPAR